MEGPGAGAYRNEGNHRSESRTTSPTDGSNSFGKSVTSSSMPSNPAKPDGVQVRIFGQRCNIVGDETPERVLQLAEIVDRKMNEIACQSRGIPALKVAILTALNVTHDLMLLTEKHQNIAERGEKMVSLIDKAVEE